MFNIIFLIDDYRIVGYQYAENLLSCTKVVGTLKNLLTLEKYPETCTRMHARTHTNKQTNKQTNTQTSVAFI